MRPVRPATTPLTWRLTTLAIFAVVIGGSWLAFPWAARLYEGSPISWPSEPFSAKDWQASFRGTRYLLFKDLDQKKLLVAKPRAELVALLGPPDAEAPDGRWVDYILKEWDGRNELQNMAWLLRVDLDGAGRVAGYELRKEVAPAASGR